MAATRPQRRTSRRPAAQVSTPKAPKSKFETVGDWAQKQEDAAAKATADLPQHEDHACEICDRPASFGFGPPGWSNITKPRTWFCGRHKHLGEELLV